MVGPRVGGGAVIAGSLGFVAVFGYLAATFDYPGVLDRPASEVLPALAGATWRLRAAWWLYAALPVTLLLGGLASRPLLERAGGRSLARLGVLAAISAAVAMTAGLVRWPTIQWALARRWSGADPSQRDGLTAIFDGANTLLGRVSGEYVGETMLAGWFVAVGLALWRLRRRALGAGVLAAGLVVWVSAQRQLTAWVEPVATLNHLVLPLGLIVVGVVLWRQLTPPRSGTLSASARSIA